MERAMDAKRLVASPWSQYNAIPLDELATLTAYADMDNPDYPEYEDIRAYLADRYGVLVAGQFSYQYRIARKWDS